MNGADAWRRAVLEAGLPPLRSKMPADAPFRASLVAHRLGALHVSEAVTPAGRCVRDTSLLRDRDQEVYQIEWVRRGQVVVEQDGNRAELGPADLVLVDPARQVRITSTATTNVTLLVPRRLLQLDDADLAGLSAVRIRGDEAPAALLSSLAVNLLSTAGQYTDAERARLGSATIELIAVALSARLGRPRPAGEEAVRARIVAFIEARLPHRDLSPTSIAAAHHMSVRRLHQLFASQPETVAALIRRRRLERCRDDLADPARDDWTIAAVATRWGFPDPAHFSRQFKVAYGHTAGEHRRMRHTPTIVHE